MTTTPSRSFVRWSLCALLAAMALGAPGAALGAQSNTGTTRGDIELTRAGVQADRTTIVTAYMNLSASQGDKFWPLYRQYRTEVQKINDASMTFLTHVVDNDKPLTEAEAKRALDTHLARQDKAAKLNQKYAKKFETVLPAMQVARLFQLENKMDAIVAFELAGSVPLVGGSP